MVQWDISPVCETKGYVKGHLWFFSYSDTFYSAAFPEAEEGLMSL
jgi:hypothetical protein